MNAISTALRPEELRPRVTQLAGDLLHLVSVAPRPVDLVSCFALPLPVHTAFAVLGVPPEDADRLYALAVTGRTAEAAGLVPTQGDVAITLVTATSRIATALAGVLFSLVRQPERWPELGADPAAIVSLAESFSEPLVRLHVEVALETLSKGLPGAPRLAVPAEWLGSADGRPPARLPVLW
ncbi:hypothetical protein ACFWY5_51205 [Nonomuraea sp. NPDC059007]|uniref:hypothetical protein n=1 Tax=Nonomuraea sp. NPDC059007 TaxID=3346692 RepID=UPI0036BCAB4B